MDFSRRAWGARSSSPCSRSEMVGRSGGRRCRRRSLSRDVRTVNAQAGLLLIMVTAFAGCSSMQKTLVTSQGPAAIKGPIAQPVWKVGNEWAYRYESPSGTGTFVWRLDRIETLANERHYVIRADTREIFYRIADYGLTKETLDGKTVREISPSTWRFVAFPLKVFAWRVLGDLPAVPHHLGRGQQRRLQAGRHHPGRLQRFAEQFLGDHGVVLTGGQAHGEG